MVAQKQTSFKELFITTVDFDRLRYLSESLRYRSTHAALLNALRQELARGTVVPADAVPEGVVTMNTQVRVRDLIDRTSETYSLVYPDQADLNENKLSVLAPLGMALLGARVGEVVKFDAPAGQRRFKVEEIVYQPEAQGDFHL